jgi:general secretion pathway protein G
MAKKKDQRVYRPEGLRNKIIAGAAGFTLVELLAVLTILICLTLITLPNLKTARNLAREARAQTELREIEKAVNAYSIDKGTLPNTLADLGLRGGVPLDPWQRPYVYVNLAGGGAPRVASDLTPLNTDFDLYSSGADGASTLPVDDPTSGDDIVRGANGGFVGLASKY